MLHNTTHLLLQLLILLVSQMILFQKTNRLQDTVQNTNDKSKHDLQSNAIADYILAACNQLS